MNNGVRIYTPVVPTVNVLSISGAHGTGKTTLWKAIADGSQLVKNKSVNDFSNVVTVESCASAWMKTNNIENYSDLKGSVRIAMQNELPGVLLNMLLNTFERAAKLAKAHGDNKAFVLIDRWFLDIAVYTQLEIKDQSHRTFAMDKAIWAANVVEERIAYIASFVNVKANMYHFYIPPYACSFVADDDKPNRGTTPIQEWHEVATKHGICEGTCNPDRFFEIPVSPISERIGYVFNILASHGKD